MTRNNKKRYFQFPLFLMQGLFDNPDAVLEQILLYGLKKYSSNMTWTKEQIAVRVCYDYYNNNTSEVINSKIEQYCDIDLFSPDLDYKGFNISGIFSPDDNVAELLEIFDDHDDFYQMCKEFVELDYSINELQGKIESSYLNHLRKNYNPDLWEKVREIKIPEKEPMPSVEVGLLLKQIERKKPEVEIIQFAGFLAVNSIYGKVGFTKIPTNKEHVLARMFGFKNVSCVSEKKHPLHEKYLKRYHFENLMDWLMENWHIRYYSAPGIRGFYLAKNNCKTSFELALLAECSKKKNRKANRKKINRQAAATAIEQIKQHLATI